MKPWWKSAKLIGAILAEFVSIAILILTAAGYTPDQLEFVSTIAGLVLQLVSMILIAMWGEGVGFGRGRLVGRTEHLHLDAVKHAVKQSKPK